MTEIPRIYIACLASYNNGKLHGAWIDIDEDTEEDELVEEIKEKVLETSPTPNAEEYEIRDSEGFGEFNIGTGTPLKELIQILCLLEEFEEVANAAATIEDNLGTIEDLCQKYYRTIEGYREFAEEVLEERQHSLDDVWDFIDFESYGEFLVEDYTEAEYDGEIYLFHNC